MVSFPRKALEKTLREWYVKKTQSQLKKKPIQSGSIFDLLPEISSTEVPEILVKIRDLMGFKVKSGGVVKLGGYKSCDEFINDIIPKLEAKFNSFHGVAVSTKAAKGGVVAHAY